MHVGESFRTRVSATRGPKRLLFHEPWWLDAASAGEWRETSVSTDGKVVARLPFVVSRRLGLLRIRMPPFTHVLGPEVVLGAGKPQSRFARRASLVRQLIDQLPRFDECKIILDSPADGLAFQTRGFGVRAQYTFRIPPAPEPEALWAAMGIRLRQPIRRAQEKFEVGVMDDAEAFVRFYNDNVKALGRSNRLPLVNLAPLWDAVRSRNAGEILCARSPDRTPAAMIFTAWDAETAYYLLSTRAGRHDYGSVGLLLWTAIQRASEKGLTFDFDGVSTSGTAEFYSGFGAEIHPRFVAYRASPAFAGFAAARRLLRGGKDESESFV